MSGKVRLI